MKEPNFEVTMNEYLPLRDVGFNTLRQAILRGELKPGDDVLFLVVAGDIREHVKATFSELLDRIKAEAVIKQEFTE